MLLLLHNPSMHRDHDSFHSGRQISLVKLSLQFIQERNFSDESLHLIQMESGHHAHDRRIAVLVFSRHQEIIVVDFPVILFDGRSREAVDPGIQLILI